MDDLLGAIFRWETLLRIVFLVVVGVPWLIAWFFIAVLGVTLAEYIRDLPDFLRDSEKPIKVRVLGPLRVVAIGAIIYTVVPTNFWVGLMSFVFLYDWDIGPIVLLEDWLFY